MNALQLRRALGAGGVAAGAYALACSRPRVACAPAAPAAAPAATPGSWWAPAPLTPALLHKLKHEALGTGLIVLLGCGGVASVKYLASGMTLGGVSIMWGTAVALAVYATADASGAHLNPAVTCALAAYRPEGFPRREAPWYVAAQLAGGVAAAGANYALFHTAIRAFEAKEGLVRGSRGSAPAFAGAFGLLPNAAAVRAFPGALGAEVLATSCLTYLIFALTDPASSVPPGAAPALVGASVTALVSVFGPVSGAGMNPARDLGPRLVTAAAGWRGAAWKSAWVYTLGPVLGALLGGGAYGAMRE